MTGNDDYAYDAHNSWGQPDEAGHQNHAPSDRPYDSGQHVVRVVEVESPGETEHGQLQQNQPKAAQREIASQSALIRQLLAAQKCAGTGQKNKPRSAEVVYPASKENPWSPSARGQSGKP